MMARDWVLVLRGYVGEVVLSASAYLAIRLACGASRLTAFALATASLWSSLVEILIGVAFTVLIAVCVNVMFTDFGAYLRHRGVSGYYLFAFATPAFAYCLADVSLKLVVWSRLEWLAHVSLGLLLYGVLNVWTLVKNGIDLTLLYMLFRRLRDAEELPD